MQQMLREMPPSTDVAVSNKGPPRCVQLPIACSIWRGECLQPQGSTPMGTGEELRSSTAGACAVLDHEPTPSSQLHEASAHMKAWSNRRNIPSSLNHD